MDPKWVVGLFTLKILSYYMKQELSSHIKKKKSHQKDTSNNLRFLGGFKNDKMDSFSLNFPGLQVRGRVALAYV